MKNLSILFLLLVTISCQLERPSKPLLQYSMEIMGQKEYDQIRDQILDSLFITSTVYPEYLGLADDDNWKVHPVFCFNYSKTRFVAALCIQSPYMSSLMWIKGFKYLDTWEFFIPSNAVHLFNKHLGYEKDDTIPIQVIKEYAEKQILGGYLKQNERGKYNVNDKYFDSLFGGSGWEPIPSIADTIQDPDRRERFLSEVYMLKVRWRNMIIRNRKMGIEKDYNSTRELRTYYSAGWKFWNQEKKKTEITDYFMRTIYEDTGWWEYRDSMPMIDSTQHTFVNALLRWVPNDEMDEVLSKDYDDYLMEHIDEFRREWNKKTRSKN